MKEFMFRSVHQDTILISSQATSNSNTGISNKLNKSWFQDRQHAVKGSRSFVTTADLITRAATKLSLIYFSTRRQFPDHDRSDQSLLIRT